MNLKLKNILVSWIFARVGESGLPEDGIVQNLVGGFQNRVTLCSFIYTHIETLSSIEI